MRLLVCGGRHYDDADAVRGELDRLHRDQPLTVLVHGGLAGIGTAAEAWARARNVHVVRYPPNWTLLGSKAEAHRNAFMLADSRPDMVLAFPGGRDTLELLRMTRAAGRPVVHANGGKAMAERDEGRAGLAGEPPEGPSWRGDRGSTRHHGAALTVPLH